MPPNPPAAAPVAALLAAVRAARPWDDEPVAAVSADVAAWRAGDRFAVCDVHAADDAVPCPLHDTETTTCPLTWLDACAAAWAEVRRINAEHDVELDATCPRVGAVLRAEPGPLAKAARAELVGLLAPLAAPVPTEPRVRPKVEWSPVYLADNGVPAARLTCGADELEIRGRTQAIVAHAVFEARGAVVPWSQFLRSSWDQRERDDDLRELGDHGLHGHGVSLKERTLMTAQKFSRAGSRIAELIAGKFPGSVCRWDQRGLGGARFIVASQ